MKKLSLIWLIVAVLANFVVAEECTPELRALTNCKITKPSYDMPGGKGHLDRIIGRDPKTGKVEPYYKDVTKEEADVVRAKSAHKEAVKKSEIAKNKLEKAKKSGKGVDKAQEEYDDAIRDVELSKAKIKDLEEIAKENKKEK